MTRKNSGRCQLLNDNNHVPASAITQTCICPTPPLRQGVWTWTEIQMFQGKTHTLTYNRSTHNRSVPWTRQDWLLFCSYSHISDLSATEFGRQNSMHFLILKNMQKPTSYTHTKRITITIILIQTISIYHNIPALVFLLFITSWSISMNLFLFGVLIIFLKWSNSLVSTAAGMKNSFWHKRERQAV